MPKSTRDDKFTVIPPKFMQKYIPHLKKPVNAGKTAFIGRTQRRYVLSLILLPCTKRQLSENIAADRTFLITDLRYTYIISHFCNLVKRLFFSNFIQIFAVRNFDTFHFNSFWKVYNLQSLTA